MKRTLVLLMMLLCLGRAGADVIIESGPYKGALATSLIRVVTAPERYAGKRIVLRGYYSAGFEHSGLYLSKEIAQVGDPMQALWVGEAKQGVKVVYPRRGVVSIVGTLRYTEGRGAGHLGGWLGEITEVEFIRAWK